MWKWGWVFGNMLFQDLWDIECSLLTVCMVLGVSLPGEKIHTFLVSPGACFSHWLRGIAWGVFTFWWAVAPWRCRFNWSGVWLEYLGFLNSWRSYHAASPETTVPSATWGKADLGVCFLPSCWLVTPARVDGGCSLGNTVRPRGWSGCAQAPGVPG